MANWPRYLVANLQYHTTSYIKAEPHTIDIRGKNSVHITPKIVLNKIIQKIPRQDPVKRFSMIALNNGSKH